MSITKIPVDIPIWEIEDYLSPQELKEVALETQLIARCNAHFNENDAQTAAIIKDGKKELLAKNKPSIFLNQLYVDREDEFSYFKRYLYKFLYHPDFDSFEASLGGHLLYGITDIKILFAQYQPEGYYKAHRDGSALTLLFWYSENPAAMQGGDLIFPQAQKTVTFKSNKAVIFPSFLMHEVTPVQFYKPNVYRYSFSAFLSAEAAGHTIFENHKVRNHVTDR
jgi:Rps23 Pro-64 3,4-dihydroxylase Tpa1-like proline 4-hydroxylase